MTQATKAHGPASTMHTSAVLTAHEHASSWRRCNARATCRCSCTCASLSIFHIESAPLCAIGSSISITSMMLLQMGPKAQGSSAQSLYGSASPTCRASGQARGCSGQAGGCAWSGRCGQASRGVQAVRQTQEHARVGARAHASVGARTLITPTIFPCGKSSSRGPPRLSRRRSCDGWLPGFTDVWRANLRTRRHGPRVRQGMWTGRARWSTHHPAGIEKVRFSRRFSLIRIARVKRAPRSEIPWRVYSTFSDGCVFACDFAGFLVMPTGVFWLVFIRVPGTCAGKW